MKARITPNSLKGKINIPSDKSFCHRTIISAFLASGVSVIENVNMCDDVKNTINIIRQMCDLKLDNNSVIVDSTKKDNNLKEIQIEESASTLRMILPIISYYNKNVNFKLGERLCERGIKEYEKFCNISYNNNSLEVSEFKDLQEYSVSTKESSQYASGILFLAAILKHDTRIVLDSISNSIGYIDLTIDVLKMFGADIERKNNIIFVKEKELKSQNITAPADGSVTLFIETLNKLGSNIEITNKKFDNSNPDYNLIKQIEDKKEYDISLNPDSIFSLLLLGTKHEVSFFNIERLKNKETNRIDTMTAFLNDTEAEYKINDNQLMILKFGKKINNINSNKDHRMVMLGIGLSTILKNEIEISDIEAISKSYPTMFEDFEKIGLKYEIEKESKQIEYKVLNDVTKVSVGQIGNINIEEIKNKKVFIIKDKNIKNDFVYELKNKLLSNTKSVEIYELKKDKEKIKTISQAEKIFKRLLKNEYDKSDYIIGFGGGTVTDLSSFVASNYKRGINLILIPTTLLSMVDASIGNKNAINIKKTKNSVGTFYAPKHIFIDEKYLSTLKEKEKRDGMAEIIKIFALSNQNMFFDVLDEEKYKNLERWIYEAVKNKINYVNKDPFDKNERKALNFGHTIGHAIEISEKISHGEAVANGMIKESNNPFIKEAINKYEFNIIDIKKNGLKQINNDKKIENNKIDLVELEKIGQYKLIKKDVDKI